MSVDGARAERSRDGIVDSQSDVRAFVLRAIDRFAGREGIAAVSVPLHARARPEALFAADVHADGVVWDPPDGPRFAGVGVAARVRAEGASRFVAVRERAARLLAKVEHVPHPVSGAPAPRLFGGLAFAPGAARDGDWSAFGDACFVLPRWTWGETATGAWLTLSIDARSIDDDERRRVAAELERVLAIAAVDRSAKSDALAGCETSGLPARVSSDRDEFAARVDAIRDAIAAGQVTKVVAARRVLIEGAAPFDLRAILARLRARHAGCVRFAFRCDGATFVGATPERLVARSGSRVATEALAGTAMSGQGAALLSSDKDGREHELVADAIVRALEPLCEGLERDRSPGPLALADVLHLRTAIVGSLREPVHVLDLAERLHPTPAVGGVPAREALAWIVAHEPVPRGWYAGPIGWFDATGDGELRVALRSGLVRGARALAYAGAGIVRGSDPLAEHAETELKLRAIRDALGVGAA